MEQLKAHKRTVKMRRDHDLEKEIAEKCKLVLKMIEEEKASDKPLLLPEKEDLKIFERHKQRKRRT